MASFKEEFKKQRAMKGSGATFEWKGKLYTTDTADGKKAAPAKPAPRPSSLNPKSGASRSTAGKVASKAVSGASRSTAGKVAPKAASVKMPERPISPTRDPKATGRYSKYETARLGNYTEKQFDALSRAQREAKGLPLSWVDYVRSGGDSVVKKSNTASVGTRVSRASAKVGAAAGSAVKKFLGK
jgi:hypothetical protein